MAIKTYAKRYSSAPIPAATRRVRQTRLQKKHGKVVKLFPVVLMTIGSLLLANAIWPILSYELFVSPTLRAAEPANSGVIPVGTSFVQTREYLLPTPKPTPVVVAEQLDYTDLSNWFPSSTMPLLGSVELKTYLINIPKVNIVDAEVAIGGTNLDKHLIQYPGTANPGEFGSPVIFGHSVLRQFYDPAINNPRRYISIFSKIMLLEVGDKIYLDSDGVHYTYTVTGKSEVKPEDIYILEQHHDSKELKLVTCVPEGTFLRRGVVSAKLEDVR